MAFPDPVTLKNAAAANVSLTRRNPVTNGNLYRDVASTPSRQIEVMIRSLQIAKSGNREAGTQNTVTFTVKRVNTAGILSTCPLSLQLRRPISADITDSDVSDLFAMLAEFLIAASGDYKTRFTRGEI